MGMVDVVNWLVLMVFVNVLVICVGLLVLVIVVFSRMVFMLSFIVWVVWFGKFSFVLIIRGIFGKWVCRVCKLNILLSFILDLMGVF